MSTIWIFDRSKNKHDLYRGEYYMKKFRESLRQHAVNKIKFENKKIIPLTNEQQELHEKTKICYICEFFFLFGFFSQTFAIHSTAGEGERHLFNSSLPLPTVSQTIRH